MYTVSAVPDGQAQQYAVSFASSRDSAHLTKIERYTGQRIESHIIPGLEPRIKPRLQGNSLKAHQQTLHRNANEHRSQHKTIARTSA